MRAPETFNTDRLLLRPVEVTDAQAIFDTYSSDEAATRFMPFTTQRTVEESSAFAQRCVEGWKSGSAYPWAIIRKDTDHFIGVIEMRLTPPKADFGYILGKAFWGQGYASEAARTVVDWAIHQPDIYRVWATCHPDNAGSAAVLRNAGLSLEATLPHWENRPQLGETAGTSLLYSRLTLPVHQGH